ncbi:hypothetical protein DNTS_025494 [Danionella cerebrum]|uniref:SAP domain-containing protein n=1 Tax=Danionella cerebrum TaxID=2873325 RepID=A0A553R9C6_9TELE|nr:hypothetical protein DNTS_025494 [Danionella translucida]
MLSAEVKKLKVTELRARLKERGLEAKGLKAELVVRLISAIEAGHEPIRSGGEGKDVCEETSPKTQEHPISEQYEQVTTVNTSLKVYNHQSTQTEPRQLCSCASPRANAGESLLQQTNSLPEHPVTLTTVASETAVSGRLTPEALAQDQLNCRLSDESERVESIPEEGRLSEKRGRDYYEFKEDIYYKRAKMPQLAPEPGGEEDIDLEDVRLDPYNCDLHFEVDSEGSNGQPLLWEKFPLIWSGCRMSHGFYYGKVGFEVKFSLSGEVEMSYGFDGRGRKVTGGKEEAFGELFTEGDIIGCYAFISETGEATLSFQKNGRSLGVAFQLDSSVLKREALYPHVLCKNCSVSVNLHPHAPWHPSPEGFHTLSTLPPGQRTRASFPAASKSQCEVLMMVGLPGSGKTHWAQAHVLQNPRKRYTVLSTNSILSCMRVRRELRLQQATQCVSHLLTIAAGKRRNYILDQTNIYPSAQRHKMLCFHGYQRKAVVVFPPDELWKRRLALREEDEGMALQEMCLLKAKVSFTLPEVGEHLEQVVFVELGSDEALKLLTQYKEGARSLLPALPKRGEQKRRHCGWRGRPFGCHNHNTLQRAHAWTPSVSGQPYGCRSDPQRYRKYYRPCYGQWSLIEQSSSGAQYGWGGF